MTIGLHALRNEVPLRVVRPTPAANARFDRTVNIYDTRFARLPGCVREEVLFRGHFESI